MPVDEVKLRKAVREAAYDCNKKLNAARQLVRATHERFTDGWFSGVGLWSVDPLGTHLGRRGDELTAAHQQLLEALKKADAAVKQASEAVKRMDDAAR